MFCFTKQLQLILFKFHKHKYISEIIRMGNHCECDCPAEENAEENKGIGPIVISKEERVEG